MFIILGWSMGGSWQRKNKKEVTSWPKIREPIGCSCPRWGLWDTCPWCYIFGCLQKCYRCHTDAWYNKALVNLNILFINGLILLKWIIRYIISQILLWHQFEIKKYITNLFVMYFSINTLWFLASGNYVFR